jgi:hypothetical protein
MAHCTSCGRELPAFSIGPRSTVCRDCKGSENSPPVLPSLVTLEERSSAISLSLILVGANLAVFVLMGLAGASLVSETPVDLVKWGADWGPLSLSTQPWRVLTSNYVQVGIIHIGFNMWCLVNLGALAERVLDRWTYFLTYTATGIAGSLASLAWHPTVVGAGASGAIFGLAGALLNWVEGPLTYETGNLPYASGTAGVAFILESSKLTSMLSQSGEGCHRADTGISRRTEGTRT